MSNKPYMIMTPADFYNLAFDKKINEKVFIDKEYRRNVEECRKGLYESANNGNLNFRYHVTAEDKYLIRVRNLVIKYFADNGFRVLEDVNVIEITLLG